MGFLLLGIDSLIACIAVGPIISRRWSVPFAALFGIFDGGGFLLGAALHWSVPGQVGAVVQTAALIALGLYLIAVAMVFAGRAQAHASSSRWAVWVLPLVLCFDNVAYGLVGGQPGAMLGQAGEQAASSALLAGAGLAAGLTITRALPAARRHAAVANGLAGGALIVASGVLLMVG